MGIDFTGETEEGLSFFAISNHASGKLNEKCDKLKPTEREMNTLKIAIRSFLV